MRVRLAVLASLVIAALGLAVSGLVWFGALDILGASAIGPRSVTEHTIDPATGEVRMTIPDKNGSVTVVSGPKVAVSLPNGLSLFPGSRVNGNSQVTRSGGGQDTLVTFEADAPAADVIAHYREQAKAAGYAIRLEAETGDTFILVAERGGAKLTATATQGTPTTGQLVVAANPAG